MKRRQFIKICAGLGLAVLPASRLLAAGKDLPVSSGNGTGLVLDDIFLAHRQEAGHPESPQRLQMIRQYMERAELLPDLLRLDPADAVAEELLAVHTSAHIAGIKENYPASYPVALAVVGAALAAVDAVCSNQLRNAFCATRPPGHHAVNTGREEGFCFFNAIAVAARYAQSKYSLRRILIVDWDYHHGNGTEAAFYSDPDVLFFSTHDQFAYPGTGDPARTGEGAGKGFTINVHLDCGAGDKDILTAFREKLLPALDNFQPELVLVSAGFDSREHDLLGCYTITDAGFVELTRMVMQIADRCCGGRVVSILEGGYNVRGNASAVLHHVRALAGLV